MAKSRSLVGQLALAGASVAAILVSSQLVQPVYVGRTTVGQRLAEQAWAPPSWMPMTLRDSAASRAPWTVADGEAAMQTARFEHDRRAFAADLMRTGRIGAARADSIATFAVREAYRKKVPPALVFGVMLAENTTFKSAARSNVGAVGLMQIYPKVWVPTLGKLFGRDLRDDETNLRYGVHILSHYVYRAGMRDADPGDAVRTGLLRYNGCVRGTNTKGCHRYPDKVMANVERYAVSQCGATDFATCVGQPLRMTLAMHTTPARPRAGD
ncbi:lytic transglycosylase domain-containing protein [Roseisolibacter sp. H3M3-2]|uniref:lytic transglycosylase domain-containing protein n=1 Tax=Roseisolibacter sp. H3M3-2 TaxID=3031323 RepID=UPI0023D9B035|nr:lytic transglycosylase domain-containing protein [Roseisolibacter sp. H3M3-2]MDF1501754.1 lytic transglycosylase domain-containing protein [Roseisolibacter sp. H3M3-2]